MPRLEEILAKDIDRTIDGVVKADDDAHVFQEIDEYVLTDEVAKQLERVVENYLEAIKAADQPVTAAASVSRAGGECPRCC